MHQTEIEYNPSNGVAIFAMVMAIIFTVVGIFGNSIAIIILLKKINFLRIMQLNILVCQKIIF